MHPHLLPRRLPFIFSCRFSLSLLLLLSGFGTEVFCQWDGNPRTVDNSIFSFASYPMVVSDDAGGAIVVSASSGKLYAQRKSAAGPLLWNNLATPVVLFTGTSANLSDVRKDGKGGLYIAFTNYISNSQIDLYLQRLDSNGNKLFGENGIKVNPASLPVNYNCKLSIGKNGITLVWGNSVGDVGSLNDAFVNNSQLYIQRFSPAGAALWPQVQLVSTAARGRTFPVAVPDDGDGTYVIFTDFRNVQPISPDLGSYSNLDVYMQYFSAEGQRQWGNADSVLNVGPGEQFTDYSPSIEKTGMTDGAGGFQLIYLSNDLLCAQKVSKSGKKSWPQDFNIGGNYAIKYGIRAISDGMGGMVASWFRVAPVDPFIFTQRVTLEGNLPWGSTPITLNSPGDQQYLNEDGPAMTVDAEGNYVFAWSNSDPNNADLPGPQLKAQKISPTGIKLWDAQGFIVCQGLNRHGSIHSPQLLASLSGKVMAVWSFQADDVSPEGRITSALLNPEGVLFDNLPKVSESIQDGDWNNPATWADGKVPAANATVTVKTKVTVSQAVTCKGLKVVSPGVVTVLVGATIVISG